jgi:hypothetical protein
VAALQMCQVSGGGPGSGLLGTPSDATREGAPLDHSGGLIMHSQNPVAGPVAPVTCATIAPTA